ncbi:hypothetical protein [Paenibacillus sp. YIM B09110]|uniref:hypothetical protein n=1 Tax=Paenibacillus sp. YIM B09110 TaxID=3126102 RepID=UPI00301D7A2D
MPIKQEQKFIFSRLPEQIIVAAVVNSDGLYTIHSKVGAGCEGASLNRTFPASKALAAVKYLMSELNMPDTAVYFEGMSEMLCTEYMRAQVLQRQLQQGCTE